MPAAMHSPSTHAPGNLSFCADHSSSDNARPIVAHRQEGQSIPKHNKVEVELSFRVSGMSRTAEAKNEIYDLECGHGSLRVSGVLSVLGASSWTRASTPSSVLIFATLALRPAPASRP
ncbi:hypothetical protein BN77_4241 [Rhizobium mesoamericanum STM3625]|uniref:Uncharacterized protein n=1 Tax=Rhizobium mesoamericanum STM3625 TaxID=1211777 RepID=K0PL89_9HYPH|nr:hypothetical protein BN77_4241 [Rhizobium mesoamericanum STM3625]